MARRKNQESEIRMSLSVPPWMDEDITNFAKSRDLSWARGVKSLVGRGLTVENMFRSGNTVFARMPDGSTYIVADEDVELMPRGQRKKS